MIPTTPPSLLDRLRLAPDDEAWLLFDSLYRPLLQRWLVQACIQSNDAEDLIQEVLRAVLKVMPKFVYNSAKGQFRSWLWKVLSNRVKDYHSKRGQFIPVEENAGLQQTIDALEATSEELTRRWDQEHDQHILTQLLSRVRPDFAPHTWQAFLRTLNGEAPVQVAASLGMTRNAVDLARARILQRLREEAKGLVD